MLYQLRLRAMRYAAAGAGAAATGGLCTYCNGATAAGVLPEYEKKGLRARAVRTLTPLRDGFYGKEIDVLGLPVRAHAVVSDPALVVAADRLARMLRNMPAAVSERLARRGAAFHIIGIGQATSDLPEHAHMKGVDGGYTGEKGVTLDQRARGMGGVHSSCGEENLIDLDSDPRYAGCDILTHEFAHCIMDVGLPPTLRAAILETYHESVEVQGRWRREDGSRAYAGSNASEYFAELTMWYFGTHGEFLDAKQQQPPPGPGGLAAYDPDGFKLLAAIYNGTHPALSEADPPSVRTLPLNLDDPTTGHSVEEEEIASSLVLMEFDNRGCDCAWRLYWLDARGERRQYAEVPRDAALVQQTFPGHVWHLVAAAADQTAGVAAATSTRELRYAAKPGACVANVSDDARCRRVKALSAN